MGRLCDGTPNIAMNSSKIKRKLYLGNSLSYLQSQITYLYLIDVSIAGSTWM